MATMLNRTRDAQRGEILLLTLVAMLVCLLAFVYASRKTVIDSHAVGNNLARQKNVQVADIGLRLLQAQVLAAYNGQPLEVSASGQLWYRDVPAGTAAPADAYWNSCLGNGDATLRCSQLPLVVNGQTLPYQVLAVVQPTGRADSNSCSLGQFRAVYYDIYLNVRDASGAASAITETVYKLCTFS